MGASIKDIALTPLKIIPGEGGMVMHALKASDNYFEGFGEAYFSTVDKGSIKGWKCHTKMVLNIVVPVGAIRFVVYDGREDSETVNTFNEFCLGTEFEYSRLTVPPNLWMAFQGVGDGLNLLLNLASIPHDPEEAKKLPTFNDYIPQYNW
jgi:dTDP-4-dehydrorhamnose 3,5-epimerase